MSGGIVLFDEFVDDGQANGPNSQINKSNIKRTF